MQTKSVKITLEELEHLVVRLKGQRQRNCMCDYVDVRMGAQFNGQAVLEFVQPCLYGDCNSGHYRFDTPATDYI